MTYPQVPAAAQRSYVSQSAPSYAASGLTGAVAASRYAGATAAGAPAGGTFAAGDYVVDQGGTIWVCTAAGSPGSWAQAGPKGDSSAADLQPDGVAAAGANGKWADSGHVHPYTSAEPLSSGEAIYPRYAASAGITLTSEALALSYWTAATSGTATEVITATAGTAASGLTYANIGIYSVAGNGNLTLLASTGDLHSSLWTGTYSTYTSALSSSFTRVAGTRYALGLLAVGTTPPILVGVSPYSGNFMTIAPVLSQQVTGQSTLPGSVAAGSLASSSNMAEAVVAP